MTAETFVRENVQLAKWTLQRTLHLPDHDPGYDDALQCALMGMVRAYERYDPTRKSNYDPTRVAKLSTYVVLPMIRELALWRRRERRHGFKGVDAEVQAGRGPDRPKRLDVSRRNQTGGYEFVQSKAGDNLSDRRRDPAEMQETFDTVAWALTKLSDPRAAIVLACEFWLGMSYVGIGQMIGLGRDRVWKIHKAALVEMRELLGDLYEG